MIYYSIAAIGLCFILKYGTILNFFRNFLTTRSQKMKELFDCSLCLGFWCGVLLIPLLVLLEDFGIKILLFPLVSACVCWTHDLLLRYVRALIYNEEKE